MRLAPHLSSPQRARRQPHVATRAKSASSSCAAALRRSQSIECDCGGGGCAPPATRAALCAACGCPAQRPCASARVRCGGGACAAPTTRRTCGGLQTNESTASGNRTQASPPQVGNGTTGVQSEGHSVCLLSMRCRRALSALNSGAAQSSAFAKQSQLDHYSTVYGAVLS